MADDLTIPESPPSWIASLRQPLSFFQALVGLLAGVVTVGGTLLSVNGMSAGAATAPKGEIVAFVHDARSHRPVAEATVEVLTGQDALVTMITVEADGHVARPMKEGAYRLRVSHPGFGTEVRQIEVHAGQRSEVRVALAQRPVPPPRVAKAEAKPASEPDGPVKQFFKTLFSNAPEGPAAR
jgi:hypothetical protein